jgi:uroporphyrinogen decarboxylase
MAAALAKSIEDLTSANRKLALKVKAQEGFIAGASHDSILEETPVENVVAMFDTVEEYGRYKRN